MQAGREPANSTQWPWSGITFFLSSMLHRNDWMKWRYLRTCCRWSLVRHFQMPGSWGLWVATNTGSISCRRIVRRERQSPLTHVWYLFSRTVAGNWSTRAFQCTHMTFDASDRHLFSALKHLPTKEFQMHSLDKRVFCVFFFAFPLQITEWQKYRSLLGLRNAGSVTLRLLCKENILLRPFGQHGFMRSFISRPCFKIILFSWKCIFT